MNESIKKAEHLIVFWNGMAYPVPYPIESDVDIVETGSSVVITYRTTSLATTVFTFESDVESDEALRLLTRWIDREGKPMSMSDLATLQSIAVACRSTKIEPTPVVYLRRDGEVWRVSRTMPEAIWASPWSPDDASADAVERAAERDANEQGEFVVQVVYRHRKASDCIVKKAMV
jgi:hypothetical protein